MFKYVHDVHKVLFFRILATHSEKIVVLASVRVEPVSSGNAEQ